MKTKKNVIRRINPSAAIESARICSLPQNQGSCSVDLGTGSALLNADALGLHLDFVSGDACVSRNVTSHVCTGSELQKRRKRDTLVVNSESSDTSGVLLHQPLQSMVPITNIQGLAATQLTSMDRLSYLSFGAL